MKKIVLMLATALTFTVASAQECNKKCECCKKDSTETCCKEAKKEVKNERPKMADMMAKNLGLSDEQKAKVEELNKKYGIEERGMQGMHRGPKGPKNFGRDNADFKRDRPDMQGNREERMENMKKYNEELKTILTPEQQEKYDNMRKDRMQGPRGARK